MNLIDRKGPTLEPAGISGRLEDNDESGGINLREYGRIFRKHWLSIALLTALGAGYASWHASTITPMYSSSLTIVIDTSRGSVTGVGDSYSYFYAARMFYDTQQAVLESRELSERTARRLDRFQLDRLLAPPRRGFLEDEIGAVKRFLTGLVNPSRRAGGGEQRAIVTTVNLPEEGLTRYGAAIQGGKRVRPSVDSQIMTLGFTSHDRELAAIVANAMADAYIDYTAESRQTLSEESGRWLAEQLERLRSKLTDSENALLEFQVAEGLLNLEDVQSLASSRLQSLNEELARAQREYEELSQRYGPKHPRLIRAGTELEAARRQLSQESQSIVLDAEKRFRLAKLENDVKSNQELYELYQGRFRQMDVGSGDSISPIYILDRAQVPGAPVSPNKRKIGTMGFFGGLFLGVLLAWIREKLDNSFHTPTQLEHELGVPTLGAVPLLGREESRFGRRMARRRHDKGTFSVDRYYALQSKSPFAESINHIRTGILYSSVDKTPKVTMISSAVQSEGKTTLAINLALALSQMGKTLLMDADLRKPRIHQITRERSNSDGLVELLIGRAEIADVLVPDEDNPKLKLLKSGVIPPNPQEMLSSPRFKEVLDELRKRFDYIVVDCAPILPVSDALVVSSQVDAFILLTKANHTTREMVKDALKRIRSVKAPLVGTVLAQFDHKRSSHYGRYSYYSKYYSYAYGRKK